MSRETLADFDAVFRARHLVPPAGTCAPEAPQEEPASSGAPRMEPEAGLADVVLAVAERGRVVVGDSQGVLDRGRLDSLVFRAWLFGILAFLEGRARQRIRRDPDWRDALSPGRLEKARALKDERGRRGRELTTVDALQFGDVGWLAARDEGWYAYFGVDSKRQAKRLVRQLEGLRNALAHGQRVVDHEWITVVAVARSVRGIVARERGEEPPGP